MYEPAIHASHNASHAIHALYFYSFVFFWLTPRAREKKTQLVKTYRDKHLANTIYLLGYLRDRNAAAHSVDSDIF